MGCPVLIHLEVNLSHHSNTVLYNNAQYRSSEIIQLILIFARSQVVRKYFSRIFLLGAYYLRTNLFCFHEAE